MDATRATWLALVIAVALAAACAVWASRRKNSMYREQLPRIYELHDLVPVPPPGAYFRNLDTSLAEYPQKLKQYRDIEHGLSELDPTAWDFLKAEATPLLVARAETRGWQALFDVLNQAKGYNYLKSLGYADVRFIPRARVRGQRTPDLEAHTGSNKGLCEVKTINISEVEASRRHSGGVGSIEDQLSDGFFNKLAHDLFEAKTQMAAYDASPTTRRIAFVIVNFDDGSHEYLDRYLPQIESFVKLRNPAPEIEVKFDIKEAFYTSMS
jgi:hypothetical protein